MGGYLPGGFSRRDFLKLTAVGLSGAFAPGIESGSLFVGDPISSASEIRSPAISLENNPVVKVLRGQAFVQNEVDIWLENTRRWEELTGGRIITDFAPWEDMRPKAAMAAVIGTGHDMIMGWYDDPHLYPDKLLDLTDLADYLGTRYGGWYPICETYGRDRVTGRWLALPMACNGACINYRKSWVLEAGFETMPGTIEGFLQCCKALKAKGHPTGFALGHALGDANTWTHWWLWSHGGKAVEADGKTIAINGKETIDALDRARELFDTMISGAESWMDSDNNKAFLSGLISVTNNGSSLLYATRHSHPDLDADLAIMNFPIGPAGRPAELHGIYPAFIFKHSTVPNAARHFLMFMFESQQYGKWINGSWSYITQSLKGYHDLSGPDTDPRMTPYRDVVSRMLSNGYSGPLGRASAAALSDYVIVDMFADACLGRKTPRSAALNAEKVLSRLYG